MAQDFSPSDHVGTQTDQFQTDFRSQRLASAKRYQHSSSQGIQKRYRSVFTEIGLDNSTGISNVTGERVLPESHNVRVESRTQNDAHATGLWGVGSRIAAASTRRSAMNRITDTNTKTNTLETTIVPLLLSRLSFVAVVLAIMMPILHLSPFPHPAIVGMGADAGVISTHHDSAESTFLRPRQSDASDVCLRWAHQSAVVNGTMYIYGGRAKSKSSQDSDTWNNNFLSMDLTTGWQISSPTIESLPEPSGPPAVSMGYLWNSQDALFLYGGHFSDKPAESPVPLSMWSYEIPSSRWEEHKSPKTNDGEPIERASEGMGVNIPSLGRGMYFGGHLDHFNTAGWDISVARVYLRSLLEFAFPASPADEVDDDEPVGLDGAWRNITTGGVQESAGFTDRADGVLVFVPGFSEEGILLSLAGGTNESFTMMNVIDVYDIAEETWYKQATSGSFPKPRVNPCAVATSAADGSSVQIHLFAGQKLLPYGEQEQHDDMWILSVPSFTWIQVDMSDQSVPPGRAGHTCHVWNAQMVVVGGYVGQDLSCDSPGIYVFNTSSLTWNTEYVALEDGNALNQQKAQQDDPAALPGSYGYTVPEAVREVIGGDAIGSATLTAPAQAGTAGPIATGKPVTYTVTDSNGAEATGTASSGDGANGQGEGGPNVAAIAAGITAGLLAILSIYLGFCAWVYRRQLTLYKRHVAVSQWQGQGMAGNGLLGGGGLGKGYNLSLGKSSLDATSASSKNTRYGPFGRPGNGYENIDMSNTAAGGLERSSHTSGRSAMISAKSSTDDLMQGQEPTFMGVFLSPRRSLKVINRD